MLRGTVFQKIESCRPQNNLSHINRSVSLHVVITPRNVMFLFAFVSGKWDSLGPNFLQASSRHVKIAFSHYIYPRCDQTMTLEPFFSGNQRSPNMIDSKTTGQD